MLNKEKITQWLIKNCTNSFGEIDLSKLDFGDRDIFFDHIKTKGNIYNNFQEANKIENFGQKAKLKIENDSQESKQSISNIKQKAIIINNFKQEASYYIDNSLQKAKEEIDNKNQEAPKIINKNQKSKE